MPHPSDRPLYVADIVEGCARFPFAPMPTAGVHQIDLDAALDIITNQVPLPHLHQTVVIVLDHERRGLGITTVADTIEADAVLHVADMIVEAAHRDPEVGAAIIASFRPGGADELDDLDRWLTIDEQLGIVGVELIEWFVVGGAVSRPRTLVGEPARWD
jgi:hypothetical protein